VNEAEAIHVLQRLGALEHRVDCLGILHQIAAPGIAFHGTAADQLHDHVVILAVVDHIEHLDDVRVVELAQEHGLGAQCGVGQVALGGLVAVRAHHLDRNLAHMERIVRQIHRAGGATAKLAPQHILAELGRQ
jgi:hypothetical protein